jgi:hypothetical protein
VLAAFCARKAFLSAWQMDESDFQIDFKFHKRNKRPTARRADIFSLWNFMTIW